MKKKNSQTLIITSVLCLLPLIMSLVVYSDLPDQIAVHWDSAGNPDNFLSKAIAAFGLPFLLAAINIFSKIRLFNDPKQSNASNTMRAIMIWMIPLISLVIMPITLYIALGAAIPISVIVQIFVGLVLIVSGNYLPKSRQNYTIGIKLPWTLHDADNWNKTHRMAGYMYIAGGVLLIAFAFISFESASQSFITISVVILLIVLPVLYSLLLYRKNNGRELKH